MTYHSLEIIYFIILFICLLYYLILSQHLSVIKLARCIVSFVYCLLYFLFISLSLSLVSIHAVFLFLLCTEHLEQKQFPPGEINNKVFWFWFRYHVNIFPVELRFQAVISFHTLCCLSVENIHWKMWQGRIRGWTSSYWDVSHSWNWPFPPEQQLLLLLLVLLLTARSGTGLMTGPGSRDVVCCSVSASPNYQTLPARFEACVGAAVQQTVQVARSVWLQVQPSVSLLDLAAVWC